MKMRSAHGAEAVLISGASRGIGEACAMHLDRLGFQVFAGVRRPEDGEALRRAGSPRLTPVTLDVTSAESCAAAAKAVTSSLNGRRLVGLVNNAGVAVAGPLEYIPCDELRRQLMVNVVGQLAVTQAVLPVLRQSGGRIVNMGSIAGRSVIPFLGPYAASKSALKALTDALRVELRPWGIHVVIIEPGGVATSIWETSLASADSMQRSFPEEARERYAAPAAAVRRAAVRAAAQAIPAARVAGVVAHALTARRPRTRYLVGPTTRLQVMLGVLLPDRLRDTLVARLVLGQR